MPTGYSNGTQSFWMMQQLSFYDFILNFQPIQSDNIPTSQNDT